MELSLRRLRMLRELHRRGTVTAAAAALHYTTSAVSQQLALLERDVGATLFVRHGRRVQLTDVGLVLAEHAEEILRSVERATTALERTQDGVTARLIGGVWASVASSLLPRALTLLAAEYPGIEVRTKELAPEDTAGAVQVGTLDFSFVIDYSNYPMPWDPELSRVVIAVERLHAVMPPGSEPANTTSLADLAEYPWVLAGPNSHFGRAVRSACQHSGFEPRINHEVGEQATALAMVAAGLGVTLVSDLGLTLRPPGIEVVALTDPLMRTISIAHRGADAQRRPLQLVIDAVRTAAAAQGLAVSSPSEEQTAMPDYSPD
ncbi:LysR substrate-binding domain-containing protein [Rhodococcus sp. NPDC060086]|uniref:LysR family transcriptional regulator n=1 Tax=Rhodococcus sp. NPDC060086 TaxID=3347055 RepID=UPI0036557762